MTISDMTFVPYSQARHQVRDADLLLFRRRGLISIAGRGDHSHAAKAAWWGNDLLFLQGFNASILGSCQPIWAVAVPVTVRYEGDALAGMPLCGQSFPLAQPAGSVGPHDEATSPGAMPADIGVHEASLHGDTPRDSSTTI